MISSLQEVPKSFPLSIKRLKFQDQVDINLERVILDYHTSGRQTLFICHYIIKC